MNPQAIFGIRVKETEERVISGDLGRMMSRNQEDLSFSVVIQRVWAPQPSQMPPI
jgi:hypothetical protein